MNRLKVSQKEKEQLNLRSDEVKEIMGHIPNRIIRYGIGVITTVLIGIMIFTFFFRYPDTISGSFYIQSSNPPIFMLAGTTGKLDHLLVNDKDTVIDGTLLAVIENSTELIAYQKLMAAINKSDTIDTFIVPPVINQLGSLQGIYGQWRKAMLDQNNFILLKYHQRKLALLSGQEKQTCEQIGLQKKQLKAAKKNYLISLDEFRRDSLLFMDKTIAEAEYQKSQRTLVSEKMALTTSELSLSNIEMSLSSLASQILELQLEHNKQEEILQLSCQQALEQLKGEIALWEKKYCLISPINGVIAFSGVWEENQNIISHQHVLTILPLETSQLLGKVMIPVSRSGKVKPGQKINLKFADFPYDEYGMVRTKLSAMSEVPDSVYIGTVYLNDSLISNYGKYLPFKQNMQGVAEIITEDISLAERMIYPLKAILNEHVD